MTASVPIPADSTGRYPELIGYQSITTERRAAVFCADVALGFGVYGLAGALSVALGRSSAATVVPAVIVSLYYAVVLWALLFKASRLSGLIMKASFVGVVSGRRAPGRLVLSFLLQGLLGAVTLYIAPLVIYFASIKGPFNRNWFDRVTGMMLVDYRTGRRPGTPTPPPPTHVGPPPVAAVQFPGGPEIAPVPVPVPDQTWTPSAPSAVPPASIPQPRHAAPSSGQPVPSAADWRMPQPTHASEAANRVSPTGGIITSTPFGRPGGESAIPADTAPPLSGPPTPVVREMRSVPAAAAPESTEVAPDAASSAPVAPVLALSDGRRIRLGIPAVFGRNPQAPGSHPDAVAYPVDDQLASKTHLLFGSDERGAWVIDLHSTNGVWVTSGTATVPTKVTPGTKTVLPVGSSVRFGDQIAKVS